MTTRVGNDGKNTHIGGIKNTDAKFTGDDKLVQNISRGLSFSQSTRVQAAIVQVNADKKKEEKRAKEARRNARRGKTNGKK
jgi:hypothetical protein